MLLMNAGHMNTSLIHSFDNTYVICFVYALSKVDLKCTTPANGPSYYRECLAKAGDKQLQEDTNRLRVGDRVSVCLDAEVLKAMSEGHGGWVDGMEQVRVR